MANLITELTETMTLRVSEEMKDQIVALSWIHLREGEYGKEARMLLAMQIQTSIAALDEKDRKNFQDTFDNLQLERQLKAQTILGTEPTEEKENGTEPIE